ncbi:endonuclease/exonuclease/phosphatase family protein [Treponema putidum]|uniref:endonuclease/exonuclease/phosphatase family protein n=1 Tax=Treponema putidum TaxID=221027 RepID=UPI003D8E2CE8
MLSRKLFIFIPLAVLAVLIFLTAGFFVFVTIAEYRPKPIENANITKRSKEEVIQADEAFKVLSWNIGYCSLDAENDFFYDGGKNVTARSKETVLYNLEKVKALLKKEDCGINLIQEIDLKSKRSFYVNQEKAISDFFADYDSVFAANYNAVLVPAPVSNPLGRVKSGVFTLSKYVIKKAERHQLPGTFSWPLKTVNLKRCLLVSEIKTDVPGKNLYIINLHLSAYDAAGILRKQEMEYLKNLALKFYNDGHWVIAGGDWNSLFPGVEKSLFMSYTTPDKFLEWIEYSPADFIGKDWKWGFDSSTPTVRLLEKPYVKGENYTTIIDGFICSPNVEITGVKTIDLNFEVSDHHPVIAEFKLIK